VNKAEKAFTDADEINCTLVLARATGWCEARSPPTLQNTAPNLTSDVNKMARNESRC
jgi:hypothetical protein